MMDRKDQDHWVCEENIARFEGQLMLATSEKNRDHLRGLLAREPERLRPLSPKD